MDPLTSDDECIQPQPTTRSSPAPYDLKPRAYLNQLQVQSSGDLLVPQTKAVADNEHAAECHCASSQHWIEESQNRSRDEDDVVEECPEQVLLDRAYRLA